MARLEELRPGTYRILRRYHPPDPAPSPTPGRWLNRDLTLEVAAGKAVMLPPLRWSSTP
jgi:hypothetical protein